MEILRVQNFNNRSVGNYSYSQFVEDFGGHEAVDWGQGFTRGHAKIVDDSTKGNVMQMRFPKGTYSSILNAGFDQKVYFGGDHDEVYFRCFMKLGDQQHPFLSTRGGKLGGLAWNRFTGAGQAPTLSQGGYVYLGHANDGYYPYEALELVSYYPAMVNNWGSRWKFQSPSGGNTPDGYSTPANMIQLPKGNWFECKHRVKMNDDNMPNGILQTWINGDLRVNVNNIKFRGAGETWGIDTLDFTFFFGGWGDSYAPAADQYIYISDILIKNEDITEDAYLEPTPQPAEPGKVININGKTILVGDQILTI